jgi:hypothetical protein
MCVKPRLSLCCKLLQLGHARVLAAGDRRTEFAIKKAINQRENSSKEAAAGAMKFQRPLLPLKRVIDSGAISMRQKDCGGAAIT